MRSGAGLDSPNCPHVQRCGGTYDDYKRVIEKVKIDILLTEEQDIASLQAVKGVERHPTSTFS